MSPHKNPLHGDWLNDLDDAESCDWSDISSPSDEAIFQYHEQVNKEFDEIYNADLNELCRKDAATEERERREEAEAFKSWEEFVAGYAEFFLSKDDEPKKKSQLVDHVTARQKEIVTWLATSKYSRPFSNEKGFSIFKGHNIRLKDGREMELVQWLAKEGIGSGKRVLDYRIAVAPPKNGYSQMLSFFKIKE